ncbi:MAG TPA: hypothetical protein VF209_05205 [Patescibacteria group bacterium]
MPNTLLPSDTVSPDEIKFGLFVKSHEVQQIINSLKEIMLLPSAERVKWVEEYQDILTDLLDSFMEDSVLAMDGLQLDSEGMDLSVELVANIREVMNSLQTILSDARVLES